MRSASDSAPSDSTATTSRHRRASSRVRIPRPGPISTIRSFRLTGAWAIRLAASALLPRKCCERSARLGVRCLDTTNHHERGHVISCAALARSKAFAQYTKSKMDRWAAYPGARKQLPRTFNRHHGPRRAQPDPPRDSCQQWVIPSTPNRLLAQDAAHFNGLNTQGVRGPDRDVCLPDPHDLEPLLHFHRTDQRTSGIEDSPFGRPVGAKEEPAPAIRGEHAVGRDAVE